MTAWTELPTHRRWLEDEGRRLLAFGRDAGLPEGGAGYLDETGRPVAGEGVRTWITCRTVHVYSLGVLLGVPGSAAVADAALAGLTGRLRDEDHGGWFHGLGQAGAPLLGDGKRCYDHAFVMLAAASAMIAERPGAEKLLAEATDVYLERFWDDTVGLPRDTWDSTFTVADDYRGLNATMHSVEAMLAVADAVPDGKEWLLRASQMAGFVVRLCEEHRGRLPEHFDPDWNPQLELNRDQPDHAFKPFGATPGHGLEWARLIIGLEAATGDSPELLRTAEALFARAVEDAWAADGADGFVYTTDWDGTPVVRERMHWVLAEAIGAAATLHQRTDNPDYADWYATWWDYAERHLIDRDGGSWWHELDGDNTPGCTVWQGKPDLYHAFQATLIPRLPLAPTLARAVSEGLLR